MLKMRPTPVPLEVISSKRRRTGQHASVLKRKVPMDETMVLLGEYVFQLPASFCNCFSWLLYKVNN